MAKKKNKKNKNDKPADEIIDIEITDELQDSYLDYAMSVIVSRALPDMRDGLKPVQRRIMWAMWDMGLTYDSKFVKSARVVGETLGKYHPHGDSAVYDTMVRMAQDFSLRYPLVEGQGNFGNIDGDNAAAQRYTEARLEKISSEMLEDIKKDTVDWRSNYDNTREEPEYLPAKLPNLLLNGTMGIAVGMATNIPPHNLGEIANAIIYLSKNPDASVSELMEYVPAPDFPTGGIIYGRKSIEEAYSTGKGSITIRAKTEIEETDGKGGERITVHEIPYQVTKSKLIEKIAKLVKDKKIKGIKDVRDESDREGLRIAIELKQAQNPDRILNKLFKYTNLQKNFHFNMVALAGGIQPRVVSLKDILTAYIQHRKNVVTRRTEHDLAKAEARAHILEGLVKALKEIDKVIETIKKSEDKSDARENLIDGFDLTEKQANAILEMRLQTLASLASKKLKDELEEKKELIKDLKAILNDDDEIKKVLIDELKEVKKEYADERRTDLVSEDVGEFNQEDFIPKKETIILLTKNGYIKRVSPNAFKVQKRGGQGLIGFDLKDDDAVENLLVANTHHRILFFTDKGKVYKTKGYDVPKASRTAKGKLVHTFLGLDDDEKVTTVLSYSKETEEDAENKYLAMVTKNGIIKKTGLDDFENIQSNGIIAINLKEDDKLGWVKMTEGEDEIIVTTKNGQAIRFSEDQARAMGRTARGVKAVDLKKDDSVAGFDVIKKEDDGSEKRLLVITEKGFGKQTKIEKYKDQKRGGVGLKTAKVSSKTGPIISSKIVDDELSQVLAFSANGKVIKTDLEDIQISGRSTKGVRVMKLTKGDSVVGIVCL